MFLIVSFTDKTNTSVRRLQEYETFFKKNTRKSDKPPIPGITINYAQID